MGPNNGPIGLCRFQFGGEALRPDGLLEVVLPSLVLLAQELVDVLLGALGNTRERGAPPNQRSPKKRRRRRCAKIGDQNQARMW